MRGALLAGLYVAFNVAVLQVGGDQVFFGIMRDADVRGGVDGIFIGKVWQGIIEGDTDKEQCGDNDKEHRPAEIGFDAGFVACLEVGKGCVAMQADICVSGVFFGACGTDVHRRSPVRAWG